MTIFQAGYEFHYGIKDAWMLAENTFAGYAQRAGQIAEAFIVEYDNSPQAGIVTNSLFTIEGAVEILSFWGVFFNADRMTSIQKVWFDVYDQTNSVPITANGVDCSGVTESSVTGRNDQAAGVAELLDADQVRIVDGAIGLDVLAPFICNAKNGAETVLRMHYTNDGSMIYFIMYFNVVWRTLIRDTGRVYGDWF